MPEALPPRTPLFLLQDGLKAEPEDKAQESFAALQAHADTAPRRPSVQDCSAPSCELTLVDANSLEPLEARVVALETTEGALSETVIEQSGHVVVRDIDVPLNQLELGVYLTPHEDGRETLEVEVRRNLGPVEPTEPTEEQADEDDGVEPPWLPFGDVRDD